MKLSELKACIMRVEGTNSEDETKRAFDMLHVSSEIVNLKQFTGPVSDFRKRKLSDYHILVFPGGFASADCIRSGAIWAALIKTKLSREFNEFVKEGKIVAGICNGFQVLTNLGVLPGNVDAALYTNASAHFECRFVFLKQFRKCALTESTPKEKLLCYPIGHGEGRFMLTPGREKQDYAELEKNNQIVFKYVHTSGEPADGKYPINPNGSYADIAGVCNLEGNVVGMMPHPERVLEKVEELNWNRDKTKLGEPAVGLEVYKSIVEYTLKKL